MTKKSLLLLLLLIGLLLPLCAFAAPAEELSAELVLHASDKEKLFRVNDGRLKEPYTGRKNQENWIEIEAPSGKAIHGISLRWRANTAPVLLERWDEAAAAYVDAGTVNTGVMAHEFVTADGWHKLRLRSTDDKGTLALIELRAFGPGELPEDVQVWQPPCTDADLLVLVAHPDDEYIFLGGMIPYYAVERQAHVAVAYMTLQNEPRLHELLDGLWTAGVREYPYVLGFFDKLSEKTRIIYKYWDEQKALDAVAELIDTAKPSVVVTQDLNGEYGHGAHRAVADLCLRVIRDGERTLQHPPKKLYLHLWEEQPIVMDWQQPMAAAGGKSALELAQAAFKCHKSQQGFGVKLRSGREFRFEVKANNRFDNAKFGLAHSTVGADEAADDVLEHVVQKPRRNGT